MKNQDPIKILPTSPFYRTGKENKGIIIKHFKDNSSILLDDSRESFKIPNSDIAPLIKVPHLVTKMLF